MDAGTDPDKPYVKVDETSDRAEIAARLTEVLELTLPLRPRHRMRDGAGGLLQRDGLNDAIALGSFQPHRLNPDRAQRRRGLIVKTGRGAEHRVGTLPGSIGRDHPRAHVWS